MRGSGERRLSDRPSTACSQLRACCTLSGQRTLLGDETAVGELPCWPPVALCVRCRELRGSIAGGGPRRQSRGVSSASGKDVSQRSRRAARVGTRTCSRRGDSVNGEHRIGRVPRAVVAARVERQRRGRRAVRSRHTARRSRVRHEPTTPGVAICADGERCAGGSGRRGCGAYHVEARA